MYLYLGTYSLGGLFGRGTGPILMDDVGCTSSEERLIDCIYDSQTSDCHHGKDVGLRCIATSKKRVYCYHTRHGDQACFVLSQL